VKYKAHAEGNVRGAAEKAYRIGDRVLIVELLPGEVERTGLVRELSELDVEHDGRVARS
jgi:hypothetical protein